ncbi:type II toxin-antitoxin system RelE/ParE family toxin [candidate division WWE3 bacterium]|nr:type II toxin-antitoxin system RelE/ParE family toxin [candidate division WWE3 bacterium]
MTIRISPNAEKQLKRLSKFDQIVVVKKIRSLTNDYTSNSEKLKGYQNIYRIGVGNFRIVFKIISNEIYIILISHRRDVYESLKKLLK